MVRGRLVDAENDLGRIRIGLVRVVRRDLIFDDPRIAVAIGVVDEEAAIVGKVGMEGEAEKAALAAIGDDVGDVEEGLLHDLAVLQDPDAAGLIDDEQAIVVRRRGDEDGRLKSVGDGLGADRLRRGGERRQRQSKGEGCRFDTELHRRPPSNRSGIVAMVPEAVTAVWHGDDPAAPSAWQHVAAVALGRIGPPAKRC